MVVPPEQILGSGSFSSERCNCSESYIYKSPYRKNAFPSYMGAALLALESYWCTMCTFCTLHHIDYSQKAWTPSFTCAGRLMHEHLQASILLSSLKYCSVEHLDSSTHPIPLVSPLSDIPMPACREWLLSANSTWQALPNLLCKSSRNPESTYARSRERCHCGTWSTMHIGWKASRL